MTRYDSLHSLHIDELSDKVGGKHKLTYLVSQRMKQINRGAPILVDIKENEALLATVCREIANDKIWLDVPEETIEAEKSDFDLLGLDSEF
ncbi:MAG: DNA-directed RNA polymerase subunit omega [Planctomycetes bacterium]|nr:DNA-directed RNA polymerase subunit omega [Planctomycetota bacterium]